MTDRDPSIERPAQGVHELVSELYEDLRTVARRERRRGGSPQTLHTTALVNELYLRLAETERLRFGDPRQFFVYAARAMRHVLLDRARNAGRLKAGGDQVRISMTDPGMGALGLAEHLGIQPRWVDSTMTGGSSYEVHVEHAAAAIATGAADVVVSVYASTPHSDRRRARESGRTGGGGGRARPGGLYPGASWEGPFGLRMPIGALSAAI